MEILEQYKANSFDYDSYIAHQLYLFAWVNIKRSDIFWYCLRGSHKYFYSYIVRIWHFYKKEYTGNKEPIDIAS